MTQAASVEEALEEASAEAVEDASALGPNTGLGVDIVQIARMEAILQRSPGFTARVFSEEERAYCEAHHRPAVHYATHFAAKEAVLKALGTGFSQGVAVRDVEVSHNVNGRPVAVLHGKAAQIAEEQGVIELPLSLSRTSDTAVANAIAVTEASRPAPEEKPNPRKELADRFKELRGMLDDMDASPEDAEPEAVPEASQEPETADASVPAEGE